MQPLLNSKSPDWRLNFKNEQLSVRLPCFYSYIKNLEQAQHHLYARVILSKLDRRVWVKAPFENTPRQMIMLGANNYLGFANNSRIQAAIAQAMAAWGTGMAGSGLLNGNSKLHKELEKKLATIKGHEDCCLFASGYQANLGIAQALFRSQDQVIYDEKSHASFIRGLRPLMKSKHRPLKFKHNNLLDLRRRLKNTQHLSGDTFVGVEGLYSIEGDLANLEEIDELRKKFGFYLVLDDAHGLGVLGQGRGSESHWKIKADVSMGTFSKTLAMTGGFVCGSKELINYLRYFAESSVFSASLPPTTIAGVLEGLKIIEEEPQLIEILHANSTYLRSSLKAAGYRLTSEDSCILSLSIPSHVNIKEFALAVHRQGLFINCIEPPAVPANNLLARLSVSACHTKEDLDYSANTLKKLGKDFRIFDYASN